MPGTDPVIRLLLDADACPDRAAISALAKRHGAPLLQFSDDAHELAGDYGEVCRAEAGNQAADHALMLASRPGDVVVTQDYGLAAMVLARGARAVSPGGDEYTPRNIDALLATRHAAAKARRAGGRMRGPKKRRPADTEKLLAVLKRLLTGD